MVNGQLLAPASLLLGKEPLVPTKEVAGWAPELTWICGEEKNLLLLPKGDMIPWLSSL